MNAQPNSENLFFVGTNYWPAHAGVHMWSDWRPDLLKQDLETMRDMGMNTHRLFLFMPDFLPTPDETDPIMLARFREYLDLCNDVGIGCFPSFFVGHMSGQDWDLSWRNGESFYSDEALLAVEERYIEDVVRTAQQDLIVDGWVLSNEIPVFEPEGDSDMVAKWAARMIAAVRKHDPGKLVGIGDGCWAPEVSRRTPNYPLSKLANLQDFLGLHFYPRLSNPWHQSFTAGFRLQMARAWGKPVMVEEFGHSIAMGSEVNQAHYYRTILYSGLINGSCGAFNWCFTDFELPNEEPYSHHPFEMRFGLLDSDRRQRPSALEMKQFSKLGTELLGPEWLPADLPNVGLVVPRNYYQEPQHDWEIDFHDWYPLYLDTFANMKRANLNIKAVFEPTLSGDNFNHQHLIEGLDPTKTPLLVLPRLKRVSAQFWQQILDYVEAGGHLYTSFAHDNWIIDGDETFGIKNDLRFGIPAQPAGENTTLTPKVDWLRDAVGDKFTLSFPDKSTETAYCPVLSTSSEVLMEDSEGNPALVSLQRGKGTIFHALYPMDMLALQSPTNDLGAYWGKVIEAIWRRSANDSVLAIKGDDLEWGAWVQPSTNICKILVVNHSWDSREGSIIINDPGAKLIRSDSPTTNGQAHTFTFTIGTKGTFIAEIQLAESTSTTYSNGRTVSQAL